MRKVSPELPLELLYQALSSRYGIVVLVSDFRLARQRLYKARNQACDPDLGCLSIHQSPHQPETELWIVRRPKELTDATARTGTDSP